MSPEAEAHQIEYKCTKSLVLRMAQQHRIEPHEVTSIRVNTGWGWLAKYDVTEEDIQAEQLRAEPLSAEEMTLDYFREALIGKWLVAGIDNKVSDAHRYKSEERRDEVMLDASAALGEGIR